MVSAPLVGTAAPGWGTALLDALPVPCGPLAPVQERGRIGLASRTLPSRRDEDWRFTALAPLTALDPRGLASPPPPPEPCLPAAGASVLRLHLDGEADPLAGVELPAGLSPLSEAELKQSLGQALEANGSRDQWPVLLNKATASRVLALRVRGRVEPVLELVSDAGAGPGLLPLRVCLVLEEQASLSLLQVHTSEGANLTSVLVEVLLGRGASLQQGVLAAGGPDSVLMAHLAAVQAAGSELSLTTASSGWGLVRCEPRLCQPDGGARSRLRGLQVVAGQEVADTHSRMLFGGPDGGLDQLHKVVAVDDGRSVFNGAVCVPRAAQRTDASQLSRSLLLSDRARVDTKPELEIVADDVRCAHGATVSRLRQEELFYLQSRGIAADQAARLLVRGYCEDILNDLPATASAWQPLSTILGGPNH